MINIDKQIKYWKNNAITDINTAEILINNKKYLHGLFFCHLTIEKIIKAHVVKWTKEIPPKTHDLFWLLRKTDIKISKETEDFLGILMKYQLEGRYPEYYPKIPRKETAHEYINKTKELLKWLTKKL